ncbi:MAG: hypothetical protein V7742_01090 [Halioglobus sp.]
MNTDVNSDAAVSDSGPAQDHARLPCRGCTSDCANYTICNGTPWRIVQTISD